jgi:hypothetical protein
MEGLAPSQQFLFNVRLSLENGQSIRMAIQNELHIGSGSFFYELQRWFTAEQQGNKSDPYVSTNIYRQSLFQTLSLGLSGHPIHQTLVDLESEWEAATKDDIERHLQRLPVLVLMPLLFLQFPAFMMLLLGPIFQELLARLAT